MSETIGFIGLGLMGTGFCKHLIGDGRKTVVKVLPEVERTGH